MKKNIISYFICSLLLFEIEAHSQSIIPPSPISCEFQKYINFEVSLYNGVPEISIPLYTIHLKDLSIPINLSYHASGIKFEQESGDVGLGWVLNPGYRISRTILGYADENKPMLTDVAGTLTNYENNAVTLQGKKERDQFLSKFVEDDPFFMTEDLDGEFDQFTFSFPNSGGGFIISDRTNKVITTTLASNLKFDYKIGSSSVCSNINGIKGFQITDEQGNKYLYGEYNLPITCACERNNDANPYSANAAVAWGITNIITPLGDEVKFNYTTNTVGGIGCTPYLTIKEASRSLTYGLSDVSLNYAFNSYYKTFFPSEIITPNERIVFTRYSQYDNRINTIQVFSIKSEPIRNIKFFYHSGIFEGYFSSTYYLLDSVRVSDSYNKTVETFRFDYYTCPAGQYAFTQDQFGYCIPGDPRKYFHENFMDDQILIREAVNPYPFAPIPNPKPLSYLADGFAPREDVPFVPNILSLKRITYPTGGYTEYEYEKNFYSDIELYASRIETAGIRIKTIKNFDFPNSEALVRTYKYGNGESGYGLANIFVDHDLFVKENLLIDNNTYETYIQEGFTQRIITYSSKMQGDVGIITGNTVFVRYPYVTEYYSSSLSGIGKTVYCFNVGSQYEVSTLAQKNIIPEGIYPRSPVYITRYSPWDNPYLYSKLIYDQNNILTRTESFEYEQTSNSFTGLKVKQFASLIPDGLPPEFGYYSIWDDYYLNSYFDYGLFTYEIGKSELKKKIVKDYSGSNTVTTEYSYEYNNLLLSRETTNRSNADKLVSYTTYPLDYPLGTPFIDEMKSKNLISYPIEKVDYIDNGISKSIISGSINQYKTGGTGLTDTRWSIENSSTISQNSFKFSNRSTGVLPPSGTPAIFLPDGRYTKKITYDSYDTKGNLLQAHMENDINVSYIWGYNQTYPVVKIEGIANNDITTQIKTNISARNYTSSSNYADVKIDVDYLKGQLLTMMSNVNYAVTFYTYKPLIGMTSQTTPNGVTTYFEYDSFGRLKNVKDNDGKITARNYYHYYNDTSSDTPYLNTSPTSMSFGSGASSSSLTISSNSTWSISDNATWLSVNTTSGTGNATVIVSVTANTSAARNATITLTYAGGLTKTVSVSQAAGSTSTLLVSPLTISFGSIALSQTVTVTSNTSWTVTKSDSWITISATSGTGNGTITIRATKLLSGTRSGTVTFKTTDNTVTRIIDIDQYSGLIE